ncbi:MAG TPA: SgcJ/EcaC family oxidoreductase [Albitalea sp.]
MTACTAVAAIAGPHDDAVSSAFQAWNGAFNKGDAKSLASLYTKDAVLLPASHEIRKGDEIEKFFAGLLQNKVTDHTLEPFEIIPAGDKLIVASKWAAKAPDEKGGAKPIGGIATHVLQRQGSSYKVKLHTFN